jgi:phosphate-selective porin OprO and OprP
MEKFLMSQSKTNFLMIVLISALSSWPVLGQTDQGQEQKLQQIEERLRQLEKQLEKFPAPSTHRASESSTSAPAEAAEKLEELDQKIKILERKRELEQEDAKAQAKSNPILKAGADGFSLRSANGSYQLRFRGELQIDGRFYIADQNRRFNDTFLPRIVRPIIEGTLGKRFEFRITPEFGGGTGTIQDVYIGQTVSPAKYPCGKIQRTFRS